MASKLAKVVEAFTGNSKADAASLRIENDSEVIAKRAAEAEAVRRAHEAEQPVGTLEADERAADAAYDQAAANGDEAATREGRRYWIATQESVRAQREKVARLQRAASAARKLREQVELEAEARVKANVYAALQPEVAAIIEHAEALRAIFERVEKIVNAAEALAPWGSPAARRHGLGLALGSDGIATLRPRGLVSQTGSHTLGAAVLDVPGINDGSLLGQFKHVVRALGLIDAE